MTLENMINVLAFPKVGDYFSLYCTRMPSDGSYRGVIFLCTAANATRVVGRRVRPARGEEPAQVEEYRHILFRQDWRFDDVTDLLPALGISEKA